MHSIRRSRIALIILGVLLLAGCSDDPLGRQTVSGTVLFKGQPLDQGAIQFVPLEKGPTETGAGIENGKYTIPRDKGLVPGKYKVSIWSYDRKGGAIAPTDMPGDTVGKQFKERIPPNYNVNTTLRAEVIKGGSNTFDFDVK